MNGEEFPGLHGLVVNGCWRKQRHFSLGVWPLVVVHPLKDGSTSVYIWAALTGLSRIIFKN